MSSFKTQLCSTAFSCLSLANLGAQAGELVYEVKDGVFESGTRYSAKLEEIERLEDGAVMKFSFSGDSRHLASLVLFRGICEYMKRRGKHVSEVIPKGAAEDLLRVDFPTNVDSDMLTKPGRTYVTPDICKMSQPATAR